MHGVTQSTASYAVLNFVLIVKTNGNSNIITHVTYHFYIVFVVGLSLHVSVK
jgi:hypothetical protein